MEMWICAVRFASADERAVYAACATNEGEIGGGIRVAWYGSREEAISDLADLLEVDDDEEAVRKELEEIGAEWQLERRTAAAPVFEHDLF